MKKSITKYLLSIAFLIIALCLFACGGNDSQDGDNQSSGENQNSSENQSGDDSQDSDLEISGVTFENNTYDYDGTEKQILILGSLPEGVIVNYTNNKATNAGTYNAKAVLSGDGYKTKELNATLTINKISYDMSGVSWDYSTAFTYDGNEKSVLLTGTFPQGVTVKSYNSGKATDVGDYTAYAVFDYDTVNYNAPIMADLNWKINKADITGITLIGSKVEYDTNEHSVQVVGNVPFGVICTYFYDGIEKSGVTEVGEHSVKCVLSGANYNELILEATLTITSKEEQQLFSAVIGNKIYFQNNLDGDKLYSADGSSLKKISNDIPNYMISSNGKLYYFGTSLFSKVIKCYDGSIASPLFSESGDYLISDGENLYYAVNNLLFNTDLNGIYKVSLSDSASEPVRLTSDKAKYLAYCDGYIYYSNASEHNYLYRIPTNATNRKGEMLNEEDSSYVISDNTNVYFCSTKEVAGIVGIARAIYKYSVSDGTLVKLTTDSGKYLVKSGDFIYYINNDKLTSTIFGDGIYRVSTRFTSDSSLPGTKIISAEDGNGYSSLTSDGNNLYYYKLNDKHFYKYNISAKTETDLMKNFVPPVEEVVLTGYSNVATYKGEVYYTDPADNSTLYKYNPATKQHYKVLADSISKMYFNGDYMYYNTYIVTNYVFWRMNLTTGEIEKLSSGRYENLCFDGNDIYCVKMTATSNYICKFDVESKTETKIYDGKSPNVVGFEKVGDYIYFIINPAIGYQYIYKYDGTSGTADELESIKAKNLTVYENKIYYYGSDDTLSVCDLNGKNITVLKSDVEINDICASNGKIYFSSSSKKNTGFFVYDLSSKTVKKISDKLANGITELNGNIYYICSCVSYVKGYPVQDTSLDGCLYCYDGTSSKKV